MESQPGRLIACRTGGLHPATTSIRIVSPTSRSHLASPFLHATITSPSITTPIHLGSNLGLSELVRYGCPLPWHTRQRRIILWSTKLPILAWRLDAAPTLPQARSPDPIRTSQSLRPQPHSFTFTNWLHFPPRTRSKLPATLEACGNDSDIVQLLTIVFIQAY